MVDRRMTVRDLRERLADLPDHYEVMVETVVGGDLGTDDVPLEDVLAAGCHVPYVRLVPDPADYYDTRALIDEGLAARCAEEERGG